MLLGFKRIVFFCVVMVHVAITAQQVEAIDKKGSIVSLNNNRVTTAATAPSDPIENDVWLDNSDSESTRPKIWDGTAWIPLDYTGTPGSIFYTGADNNPAEDNTNLFWDTATSRLGLGTNTPDARLDVEGGTVRFSDYGAGAITGTAANILAVDADGDLIEVDLAGLGTDNQTLATTGTAGQISISSGNAITLNVNDADANASNEIQTISKSGNTITLSNSGGSVTETKTSIAQNTSTGVITHTSEDATLQAVNVVSTNTSNSITAGTDGGAYFNNPIKAYGTLVPATNNFTAIGIASAIKNGTGRFTFTMSTTRSGTNYPIQLSVLETGTNNINIYVTAQTTTTFSIAIIREVGGTFPSDSYVDRTCYFTILDF